MTFKISLSQNIATGKKKYEYNLALTLLKAAAKDKE